MRLFQILSIITLAWLMAGCTGKATGVIASTPEQMITRVSLPEPTVIAIPNELEILAEQYDQTATMRNLIPSDTPGVTSTPSAPNPTFSFTPTTTKTVDLTHIVTNTPASAALCLPTQIGTEPIPDFLNEDPMDFMNINEVLDYATRYGLEALAAYVKSNEGIAWGNTVQAYQDLTHDGVPEMVLGRRVFYIIGCQAGRYQALMIRDQDGYGQIPLILQVLDANRNGIPELTMRMETLSQGGHYIEVFEWDGKGFRSLLMGLDKDLQPIEESGSVWLEVNGAISVIDENKDGLSEYMVNVGIPTWSTYEFGIPWRQEQDYYHWNGSRFVLYKVVFSAPEYRFQAVQDGDRAMKNGEFDRALDFYQQAIFSDQLQWWSFSRYRQVFEAFWAIKEHTPTPTLPAPDPLEYEYLTAYSRYKIVVLHAARGWQSDAQVVYDTLQSKYPPGSPGHIYAQLAEHFWVSYTTSQDAGKACKSALEFAADHIDEITLYLGGKSYHGINSTIIYDRQRFYLCPIQ